MPRARRCSGHRALPLAPCCRASMPPPRAAPASLQRPRRVGSGEGAERVLTSLTSLPEPIRTPRLEEGFRKVLLGPTCASRAHPPLATPPLSKSQPQRLEPAGLAATFTLSGAPGQTPASPSPFPPSLTEPKASRRHTTQRRQLRREPWSTSASLGPEQMTVLWWVHPTVLDSQWSPQPVTI